MQKIAFTPVLKSRLPETDFSNLPFGHVFSDHMFVCDYIDGAWQNPQVIPFGDMSISPANMALHYGQSIFEGIKAQRCVDGELRVFRPQANLARLNRSAERMGMPSIPDELFFAGLDYLLEVDRDWAPTSDDSSLYIRPVMFAMDGFLGVRASDSYRFIIMTGPTGPYYSAPVKLWAEDHFVRASRGGTGSAKAAGNYAGSIMPAAAVKKRGFDQILWLDGMEYKYLQECGTMNVFAIIGDTIMTPELGDTVLDGVTRNSLITLWREQGFKVEERPIDIAEIIAAHKEGTLREFFGVGTAAVISHVTHIQYKDSLMELPPISERKISPAMKAYFEDLKAGKVPDTHSWLYQPKKVQALANA